MILSSKNKVFLRKVVDVGTGICDALNAVVDKKVFVINLATGIFKGTNTLLKVLNGIDPDNILKDEWVAFPTLINKVCLPFILNYNSVELLSNECETLRQFDVNGTKFMVLNHQNNYAYYYKNDKEKSFQVIRNLFWKKCQLPRAQGPRLVNKEIPTWSCN